jgi:hypothetical protein
MFCILKVLARSSRILSSFDFVISTRGGPSRRDSQQIVTWKPIAESRTIRSSPPWPWSIGSGAIILFSLHTFLSTILRLQSTMQPDRNATAISIISFCAVALLRIGQQIWIQRRRRRTHQEISERGEALLTPTLTYIYDYLKCLQDQCDPYINPRGYIPLCVSENKLITELVGLRMMQIETSSRAFSDSAVYCYNNSLGLPGPREAIAYFLGK